MKAFFDIDTQIDFVFPAGALYGAGGERVVPHVAGLNRYAATRGIPVISTMCAHPEDAAEFREWAPHCVAGTFGQQKPGATLLEKRVLVPNTRMDVNVEGVQQIIVEKNALDLFTNPNIEGLIERLGIEECFVYGVFLEYCVACALRGLLARGKRVSLVTEGAAWLDRAAGEQVLSEFTAAGGRVVAAAEVVC